MERRRRMINQDITPLTQIWKTQRITTIPHQKELTLTKKGSSINFSNITQQTKTRFCFNDIFLIFFSQSNVNGDGGEGAEITKYTRI